MENKQQDHEQTNVNADRSAGTSKENVFMSVKRVTAWIMIISAVLFALVGLMGIWQLLGEDTGDIVWRASSSLLVIAFASLIVNVASRVGESKH
jgi:hypothetical protein